MLHPSSTSSDSKQLINPNPQIKTQEKIGVKEKIFESLTRRAKAIAFESEAESANPILPAFELVKEAGMLGLSLSGRGRSSELSSEQMRLEHCGHDYSLSVQEGRLELKRDTDILLESVDIEIGVGDSTKALPFYFEEDTLVCNFDMQPNVHFYGGGESFSSLVKNNVSWKSFNTDALGVSTSNQYQCTPVFWSSNGFAFYLESPAPLIVDFGSERNQILKVQFSEPDVKLWFILDPSPQSCMKKFRQKFAPAKSVPDWSFELWLSRCYYQNEQEVRSVVTRAKQDGLPFGVINLDARCWMAAETRTDFQWDTTRFKDFHQLIADMNSQGVEVCLWENPYVSSKSSLYQEFASAGFFAKNYEGEVYPLDWVPDGLEGFPKAPLAGLVDFTNPRAKEAWKHLHRSYLRAGVKSFKTDFGEEIPPDCVFYDGRTGWQLRNQYADLYNACVQEVIEEEIGTQGCLWARSGFVRAASHPVKWGGDSQTNWRSLRSSLRAALNQAIGGAVFWATDTGGFYGPKPDPELYLRWAQVSFWMSHVRTHGTTTREPWDFGEETYKRFETSLAIRLCLKEYFLHQYRLCVENHVSFVRPLWMMHPEDLACRVIDTQFYAGEDFLVAPYLTASGGVEVYLPEGRWLDLTTGKQIHGPVSLHKERGNEVPVFLCMRHDNMDLQDKCSRMIAKQN